MRVLNFFTLTVSMIAVFASHALAGPEDFTNGPVFTDVGSNAVVNGSTPIPADTQFKIAFDTAKAAEDGKINRTLESAARFINMHVRAGVPKDNIHLAVVIHGKAVKDVTKPEGDTDAPPTVAAVKAMLENNVRIIVCGQSAAYYDVTTDCLTSTPVSQI